VDLFKLGQNNINKDSMTQKIYTKNKIKASNKELKIKNNCL